MNPLGCSAKTSLACDRCGPVSAARCDRSETVPRLRSRRKGLLVCLLRRILEQTLSADFAQCLASASVAIVRAYQFDLGCNFRVRIYQGLTRHSYLIGGDKLISF